MSRIVHLRNGHYALRAVTNDEPVLLTIPSMHPNTPPAVRTQILELVLRRLYGEAFDLANATADQITRKAPERARLAVLMAQTPHKNARGFQAAA